jgi:hypothetical protein
LTRFAETLLTGRHETIKTGRKKRLAPPLVPFHVFMLSCFPVENNDSNRAGLTLIDSAIVTFAPRHFIAQPRWREHIG